MSYASPIMRLTTGFLDTINDVVIGGMPAFGNSLTLSMLAGQLGQGMWLDDSQIQTSSAISAAAPVLGGHFRYVRLAAAATAVVRGQIVFWDNSVADNLFQVTTSEAGSVPGAQFPAGIVLNAGWTAGRYGIVQDVGPTFVKFVSALTAASLGVGTAAYCAAFGAGANNGFADILGAAIAAPTSADIGLLQNRYLGATISAIVNSSLGQLNLNFHNLRG